MQKSMKVGNFKVEKRSPLIGDFSTSWLGQCPGICKQCFFDCRKPGWLLPRTGHNPGRNLVETWQRTVKRGELAVYQPRKRKRGRKKVNWRQVRTEPLLAETRQNPAWRNEAQTGTAEPGGTRRSPAQHGRTWRNPAESGATRVRWVPPLEQPQAFGRFAPTFLLSPRRFQRKPRHNYPKFQLSFSNTSNTVLSWIVSSALLANGAAAAWAALLPNQGASNQLVQSNAQYIGRWRHSTVSVKGAKFIMKAPTLLASSNELLK